MKKTLRTLQLNIKKYSFLLLTLLFIGCAFTNPSPNIDQNPISQKKKKEIDPIQMAYKYYVYASISLFNGDISSAKKWLLDALKMDPESEYLNKKMAVILEHMREYEGAIGYMKRCVELNPSNIHYRIMLADLYGLAHKYELAIKEYKEVLKKEHSFEFLSVYYIFNIIVILPFLSKSSVNF